MKHTQAIIFVLILWALAISTRAENVKQQRDMPMRLHVFMHKYCIDCHGADKQKGDRAFHDMTQRIKGKLKLDLADENTRIHLEEMLDQLNLGEMPPKKKPKPGKPAIKQPNPDEVRKIIGILNGLLKETVKKNQSTVMRRLNKSEYQNTMRDLLGLKQLAIDPTIEFPADDDIHGFKNIGDALNLTDAHLAAYLNAAETYLNIAFPEDKLKPQTLVINPIDWGMPTNEKKTPWMYKLATPGKYVEIGAGLKDLSYTLHLATIPHRLARSGGMKRAGYYRFTLNAEAIRRLTHPYNPNMIPTNLNEPMQLGLYIADDMDGTTAGGVKKRRRIGLWDLKDHKQEIYEVEVWLEKGSIPFINWDNGPGPTDYWMRDICRKYHDDIEFRGKEGAMAWHVIGKHAVPGRSVSDVWRGPLIRLHEFKITGPLNETSQISSKQAGLKAPSRQMVELASDITKVNLMKFIRRAFRRPVTISEVAPYGRLAKQLELKYKSRSKGMRLALSAVLTSPDFLYLREVSDEGGKLKAYELANRLSYFLWRSMPDQALFAKANDKSLLKPEVLKQETLRLLRDPKSKAFIEDFANSWLRLDKLGTMAPDKIKFGTYYLGLEEAMREETLQFITHVLKTNRPISDFLNSNYTFVNQDLAQHYGMTNVVKHTGHELRKVNLPPKANRGGLLGHASILTLTANGVDTSPIIRGIWVLENILGTPPAPPPPDVEPLEPDVRGSVTLKQKLAKHRTVETCADCHNKIDPLGFPLENFDPIGGYRPTYYKLRRWDKKRQRYTLRKGHKVDPTSELASGEKLNNIRDLKKYLLTKQHLVARNLTEKLLTFGTGREMTVHDHEVIDGIVKAARKNQYKFKDMLLAVVLSETFGRK